MRKLKKRRKNQIVLQNHLNFQFQRGKTLRFCQNKVFKGTYKPQLDPVTGNHVLTDNVQISPNKTSVIEGVLY